MHIPFLRPGIQAADIKNMVASIKTGWLAPGPQTEKFEKELAKYLGVKEAVFMNSATSALHISLILAGVSDGDEVITTPLSYVATSNVILHQRAVPVFADVDVKTGLIDLDLLEKKITKKTKAVIVVHLYGQMIDIVRLHKIATAHNIHVIEDAAHALESIRDGIRPGQKSLTACFSFHAAKNITSGQGGALATNDPELAKKAKLLRRDGVINKNNRRFMHELGHKYDAADFQPALLIGQLKRIKTTHKARQKVFSRYAALCTKHGIDFPNPGVIAHHACHMFVVYVDTAKRDDIREKLLKRGIETSIHYHPIHLEPFYQAALGHKEGTFPNAEKQGSQIITLPTYGGLTIREQDYIIAELKKLHHNA